MIKPLRTRNRGEFSQPKRARIGNFFSIKSKTVNILGFLGQTVTSPQTLVVLSATAATQCINNWWGYVPIQLY